MCRTLLAADAIPLDGAGGLAFTFPNRFAACLTLLLLACCLEAEHAPLLHIVGVCWIGERAGRVKQNESVPLCSLDWPERHRALVLFHVHPCPKLSWPDANWADRRSHAIFYAHRRHITYQQNGRRVREMGRTSRTELDRSCDGSLWFIPRFEPARFAATPVGYIYYHSHIAFILTLLERLSGLHSAAR